VGGQAGNCRGCVAKFEFTLATGKVSEDLRRANVVPFFKKGGKD